eukprot:gene29779-51818_t
MCVASEDHRFLVADAVESQGAAGQVLLEPAARNTAAAMALAALLATSPSEADPLLLFCPSDHHIPDVEAFAHTIRQGVPAAEAGAIVTFGVVPSFPSTAYGYIEQGDARADGSRRAARFIEKPAPAAAQALLLQGNVLWNAGIFLVRASTLLTALGQHADDILQSCRQAMANQAVARQGRQLQGVADTAWSQRNGWGPNNELVQTLVRESAEYRTAVDKGEAPEDALKALLDDSAFLQKLRAEKTRVQAGFL